MAMFDEEQFIPISALQHWLYCPRQCALIHLEQAWAENKFTAEGRVMHENAHEGADETRAGVRITRGMPVVSQELGITGQCDVVEFAACGGDLKLEISDLKKMKREGDSRFEISDLRRVRDAGSDASEGDLKFQISNFKCTVQAVPVEYKRGKPKAHRADEVQLCAQGMCLEEMLGTPIAGGCLYYGEKRRRTDVVFDDELRELVRKTVEEIRRCFACGVTPTAEYDERRCDNCSLMDLCQPQAMRFKKGVAAWFSTSIKSEISNLKSTET
jgi:CRISPR-associated exonuclease Cas4